MLFSQTGPLSTSVWRLGVERRERLLKGFDEAPRVVGWVWSAPIDGDHSGKAQASWKVKIRSVSPESDYLYTTQGAMKLVV